MSNQVNQVEVDIESFKATIKIHRGYLNLLKEHSKLLEDEIQITNDLLKKHELKMQKYELDNYTIPAKQQYVDRAVQHFETNMKSKFNIDINLSI